MSVSRRNVVTFLSGAVAASTNSLATPNVARAHARRVSQGELDGAIARHALWFEDSARGGRAVFSNCDLSGLDLGSAHDTLVNLRGSDFTGSDLTGITGDNLSFLRASLHGARLAWSYLKRPSFSYASLRDAKCDNAVWGWDARSASSPAHATDDEGAVFLHADAGRANFTRATIRGYFVETTFVSATLVAADLSYSRFCGPEFSATSFFRADLTEARFRSAELRNIHFRRAICDGIDFTDVAIGPRVRLPANHSTLNLFQPKRDQKC